MCFGVSNHKTVPREFISSTADSAARHGPVSSALAAMFRGKLCDAVLWNHSLFV